MNKQCVISVVVMFVFSLMLGFLIHGVLLADGYLQLPNLMRTQEDAQRHFPAMLVANFCIGLGFTVIYRRGREAGKDWLGQGVRFGLWFVVAATVPMFAIYYAVQPMPLIFTLKQIALETVGTVMMGIVVAALNKLPA